MDELSAFAGAPPELARARSASCFRSADVVFTGGQTLYEAKRAHPPERARVSEQRRRRAFCAARATRRTIPPIRPRFPARASGSSASSTSGMDIDLVRGGRGGASGLASRAGRSGREDRSATLPRAANIHYLGAKAYDGAAGLHRRLGRRAAAVRAQRSDALHQPDQDAGVPRRRAGRWSRPRSATSCAPTASAGSRASPIHLPTSSPRSTAALAEDPTRPRRRAADAFLARHVMGRHLGGDVGLVEAAVRSAPEQARRHIRPTPASMARRPPRERGEGPVHVRLSRSSARASPAACSPSGSPRSGKKVLIVDSGRTSAATPTTTTTSRHPDPQVRAAHLPHQLERGVRLPVALHRMAAVPAPRAGVGRRAAGADADQPGHDQHSSTG